MTTFPRSAVASLALFTATASLAHAQLPPKSWVDKDTGHRVWRLSEEPNSGGFYFNINAYTPDHKSMIYTAPDGIHVLDMETHKTRLLVPNPPAGGDTSADPSGVRGAGAGRNPHALVAGSKTNSVFFTCPPDSCCVVCLHRGGHVRTCQIHKGSSVNPARAAEACPQPVSLEGLRLSARRG